MTMTTTHDKLNPLDAAMRDELLDRGVAAYARLHDLVPAVLSAATDVAEVRRDMSAVQHGLTDDEFDDALGESILGQMTDLAYFLGTLLEHGPDRFSATSNVHDTKRWMVHVVRYAL